MRPIVRFWAAGVPVPQGSKSIWQGRIIDSKKTALDTWRASIRRAALMAFDQTGSGGHPIDAPVKVRADFYVPQPQRPRWKFWPATKGPGGIDKLTRALLDAISVTKTARGIIRDDSRVVKLDIASLYAVDGTCGVSVAVSHVQ